MRIQHNIMSMNAYRNYNTNTSALSKNLEKLSSGYKINRAGDDAAGLAISEKMRAQITGLTQAQANAKSGINLVQTAEGALQEVHDMLNRMMKLADQSANGTYDNDLDRTQLQKEVKQLNDEINRIADSANFNGIKLLNGKLDGASITKIALEADPANDGAGLDLTIRANQFVDDNGDKANLTFDFSTGTTEAIEIDDSGVVTITLDESKDYTAADIAELIKGLDVEDELTTNAGLDADDDADLIASIKAAVDSITVSGKGTSGIAGGGEITNETGDTNDPTGAALTLQIGDTAEDFDKLSVTVQDMHTNSLGIDTVNIGNQDGAAAALQKIKDAINMVSDVRGTLGATQNRLDHTINNLSVMTENIQDAESTIRDTDVADEMMAYTKNNILIQSAQAMLAQANQVPQGVLQLLQ